MVVLSQKQSKPLDRELLTSRRELTKISPAAAWPRRPALAHSPYPCPWAPSLTGCFDGAAQGTGTWALIPASWIPSPATEVLSVTTSASLGPMIYIVYFCKNFWHWLIRRVPTTCETLPHRLLALMPDECLSLSLTQGNSLICAELLGISRNAGCACMRHE